jgi:transcriptional regulator with XRE-family HTH domain
VDTPSDEIARVRRVRRRREQTEEEFRAAIVAARAAGATLQAIADAAGVSRQYVWQLEKGIR